MVGYLNVKGGVALACLVCGAGTVVDETISKHKCRLCAGVTEFKRCKRCKKTAAFTPAPNALREIWKCPGCGWKGGWHDWRPGRVSEYEPEMWLLTLYGKRAASALSDTERRRIDGTVLSATGISGLTTGGATVFFDRESVTVMIADVSHRFKLDYVRDHLATNRGARRRGNHLRRRLVRRRRRGSGHRRGRSTRLGIELADNQDDAIHRNDLSHTLAYWEFDTSKRQVPTLAMGIAVVASDPADRTAPARCYRRSARTNGWRQGVPVLRGNDQSGCNQMPLLRFGSPRDGAAPRKSHITQTLGGRPTSRVDIGPRNHGKEADEGDAARTRTAPETNARLRHRNQDLAPINNRPAAIATPVVPQDPSAIYRLDPCPLTGTTVSSA